MQLAICWSGNSQRHQRRQKYNCLKPIVTQFIDVLFLGVIHTTIRKLTGSYSDTLNMTY